MAQQAERDNLTVPFIRSGVTYVDEAGVIKTDGARAAVLAKLTVMGKSAVTIATTGDGTGNTGNGTVTAVALAANGQPMAGSWNLEATEVKGVATSSLKDAGNTGDGTVTGFAISATGDPAIPGTYILKCTNIEPVLATRTAGTVTADAGNTGDGTSSSTTPGAAAIEGTYTITCVEVIANGGRFEVKDPTGNRLEDLYVGVAYNNDHLTVLTISDGGTDFALGDFWTVAITVAHGAVFKLTNPDGVDIAEDITLAGGAGGTAVYTGNGITFTVTDGATDFAVDDFFNIIVTGSDYDKFKLENPQGTLIANDIILPEGAGTTVTVVIAGMVFTITDGTTDFIVGDKFAIVVTIDGDYVPMLLDQVNGGEKVAGIYMGDEVTAAKIVAGDVQDSPMLIGGNCTVDSAQIIFDDGASTVDTVLPSGLTVREELARLGIYVETTIDVDSYEA
jgi:hypothetical protein